MQIVSRQPSEAKPARMNALAVLPVFYSLKGKRVIVAGGSDAAAWKAELLAASGADVEVYTPDWELSEDMRQLLRQGAADGTVSHLHCEWQLADFSGAALIVGDVEEEDAQPFVAAARAAGVPVNVIDKPAFCDFQFGSIINRSPVIVGISTDGGAPVLGQAVRRRIETLLPKSLGAWGAVARELREQVMARLKPGAERRAFWERFVDRAFTTAPGKASELLDDIAGAQAAQGRVTLVGAGPGDAELLTIKAVRALQAADVILFDDLVSPDVLELARREAKRTLVGKRGGRQSCRQEDINRMMLSLAGQGRNVVRLKGGDPSIFGRSGEETESLVEAGIPVEIVPGITSASALAARLGISLTHRDHARSVRFVTGHSRNGDLPDDLDWQALADPAVTTVFYMSRATAPRIAETLIGRGLDPHTPCAVGIGLTRADETVWQGRISELDGVLPDLPKDAPFLLAVGNVTRRAEQAADGATQLQEPLTVSA